MFESIRRIVTFPIGSAEGTSHCLSIAITDNQVFNSDSYFMVVAEEEDLNVRFGFSSNSGSVLVRVEDNDVERKFSSMIAPCNYTYIKILYS